MDNEHSIQNLDQEKVEKPQNNTRSYVLKGLAVLLIPIHLIIGYFVSFYIGCGGEGTGCNKGYFDIAMLIIIGLPVTGDVIILFKKNKSALTVIAYLTWLIQPIIILLFLCYIFYANTHQERFF